METQYRGRGVCLDETLVVADLHLGRARTSAIEVPLGDGADVIERLDDLVSTLHPETVVLAGDVLHSFDSIPDGVAEDFATLEARVEHAGAQLIVVGGNHDTMLDSVWDGPVVDYHRIADETVVVHGHETPSVEASRYVLGHDHPAIEIEGQRRPCFLRGAGGPGGAEVLVLPAFNRLAAGVPINGMDAADFQSPLVENVSELAPIVRDEDAGETLRFPNLGAFRHQLP